MEAKRDQKAGENLRARSLAFYNEYSPEICVRTSLADYKQTENLYDVPLYMVGDVCYQECVLMFVECQKQGRLLVIFSIRFRRKQKR